MTNNSRELRALDLFEQALEQPSGERRAWVEAQTAGDEALAARVRALLSHDSFAQADLTTGGAGLNVDDGPLPDRIGAYRIDGLIGRGGMGAVYKGVRDAGDFDHTVAIKVIRPGLMRDTLVERFERERQILADLNHPNIAKLMDGGTLESGAPYFVMEYVDGMALTDWADARGLSLTARTELMITVCEAVGFAHQNLIIHRDLTPSNVLVTEGGQVKLIDFGIARPDMGLGAGDDPAGEDRMTSPLPSLSFTPGYGAPERSRGAAVSTLSDVYSLGRLLRALTAAGRRPKDLAKIIEKACQTAPEARYASVADLVGDLRAFLEKRPVAARSGGGLYTLGRLLARRPLALSAGGLALAGLVGGLVLVNGLYLQAKEAERQAAQRFEDVRALSKTVMFDVYDAVDRLPGSTEAQLILATASQGYLDDLEQGARSDLSLKIETAQALVRLADIQGSPARGARLDTEAAKVNLERAVSMLEDALESTDRAGAVRLSLIEACRMRSQIASLVDQDLEAASHWASRALEASRAPEAEEDSALLAARLRAGLELALIAQMGEDQALPKFQVLVQDAESALARFPDDTDLTVVLAEAESLYGRSFTFVNRGPEGLGFMDAALERINALIEAHPDDAELIRVRAKSLHYRGFARMNSGQGEGALSDFRGALDDFQRLKARDPNNQNWIKGSETVEAEMVGAYAVAGRLAEAEAWALRLLDLTRARRAAGPDTADLTRREMLQLWDLSLVYHMWDKPGERCATLSEMQVNVVALEADDAFFQLDAPRVRAMRSSLEQCY